MLKEINFFSVYLSPILLYLAVAAVMWFILHWILQKLNAYRYVWHPPLFNTALFVILLAAAFYCLNFEPRPTPLAAVISFFSSLFGKT